MRILNIFCLAAILFANCKTPTTNKTQLPMDSTTTNTQKQGGSEFLYTLKWKLIELKGQPVTSTQGMRNPELAFFAGQIIRVSGNTGCNTLNGTVELSEGNGMKFSPLATTRRMCPGSNELEQQFLAALRDASKFSVSDSTLILLNGDSAMATFRGYEDAQANSSEPPLNDESYRRFNDKLLSGTDFLASGNEPFWSLEINLEKEIIFKMLDGDSINTPIIEPTPLQDVAATSYRLNTAKGSLTIIIYDQPCVDDMSGITLPKKVEVTYNEKRYSGCGRYLADYRLDDLWKLHEIDGKPLDSARLMKGIPTLQIKLNEKQVSGHSGCNVFGGMIDVKGRFMSLDRVAGTLMACDDNGFERDYLNMLSSKMMRYTVENGTLTIKSGNHTLRYKKTD